MLRMFLLVSWGLTLAAQTQIDLRTQAKNIDFSAANSTRPMKMGTVLPAACATGDMFFKTDAPAGENLYGCTAANAWSVQGGIPIGNCQYNTTSQILTCTDSNNNVYATVETATSGTPNQWVDYIASTGIPHTSRPTATDVGAVADPGSNGIPYRNALGTAVPANVSQMSGPFFCQDAGAGGGYACSLNPPVSSYQAGTSYWFKAGAANSGPATVNFNALGPKNIVKQYNQTLAANDIQAGQWVTVIYDGTNMQMQSQTANAPQAAVASVFGRAGTVTAQSGDYNTGQVTESGNQYFTNARVWGALSASSPISLNASTGALGCPSCVTSATAADTDLYGTFPHLSVVRLQGQPVASTPPANQQYLGWNSGANQWQPTTLPGAPVSSVFGRAGTVTAQSGDYNTAQVTESGNQYFTNARVWGALSASSPISFNASTGALGCPGCVTNSTAADTDLSGTFPHLSVVRLQGLPVAGTPPANQQYLGWNSGANQWQPTTLPGAPVSSMFGRTGAVTAQSGDYSFAQVSGTASAAQLPSVAMLTNQSNAVTAGTQDFSNAAHTLPMKAGTTAMLPPLCARGETYFATDAPAGGNVYGCTAANVWSAQGNLSVKSGGATVGTRGAANFIVGAGLMSTVSDDGSEINIQSALDTAVVETQSGEQSGRALLCASSSGSASQYACALNPTLAAYTSGMALNWKPDVAGAGGPTTLNVDTLGAMPLKLADGMTDPAATAILAGQLYAIWYDGSVFRISGGATTSTGSMTYPGAGVANSTGSAWGPSYAVGNAANDLVQLNASGQLPGVSAALLTNFPTLNQNTSGTASNVTGTVDVANGGTGVAALPGVSGSYLFNNGGALGAKAITAPDLPAALSDSASVNGTAIPPNATLMTTSTTVAALQMPALTGDATSAAGGVATTVGKVNGASVPANAALLGTNAGSQLVAQTMWGSGTKPVAASLLGVSGNCVQWSSAGIGDAGSPCGTGSGSGGANTLGYYLVSQSSNEPANAVNLGALSSGLLKIAVSGGVATPTTATAGADYVTPVGSITGTAANVTGTVAVVNGGTGVAGALSGLVRGSSSVMTAAELSGDAATSGSNVVTVMKVNGTGVPTNSSADQVLGTSASATGAWMSVPNCGSGNALQYSTSTHAFSCGAAGSSATRTWPVTFSGMGQAGVTGFSANLPASSSPTPTNSGGAMPIAVLEWPTAQSAYYAWWTWILPAGYASNSAIAYSLESRCNATTCDSTHNNIVTLGLGCSAGAALDAPAIVNASAVNVKNGPAAIQTITTGTVTPNTGGLPACAAGNRAWLRMIVDTNTNSLTGPFDLVSVTFSVQGGL